MPVLSARLAPFAALLTAAILTVPASALDCPLVPDQAGDGSSRLIGAPNMPALDLLGLDVASGATTVVVRLHVADLTRNPLDPHTHTTVRYAGGFYVDGQSSQAVIERTPQGDTAFFSTTVGGGRVEYPVAAVVDPVASTITWTIARALVTTLDPGDTFEVLHGGTWVTYGVRQNADALGGEQVYVDGTPGCVAAA